MIRTTQVNGETAKLEIKRGQARMALPTVSNIRTFRAMLILSIFGAA